MTVVDVIIWTWEAAHGIVWQLAPKLWGQYTCTDLILVVQLERVAPKLEPRTCICLMSPKYQDTWKYPNLTPNLGSLWVCDQNRAHKSSVNHYSKSSRKIWAMVSHGLVRMTWRIIWSTGFPKTQPKPPTYTHTHTQPCDDRVTQFMNENLLYCIYVKIPD